MYDKIKLWIDGYIIGEQLNVLANYLDKAQQQTDLHTGETKTFGSLDGLKVSIWGGGVSVMGSLPKYWYNSNVYTMDRKTTALAIAKISDSLHIDLTKAVVTELEFGTNFLMRYPVQEYLKKLGSMPRLQRYNFEPSTLYYKGKGRTQPKVFALYDKIADAKAKGMCCPDGMDEANMLRYEMRLKGRLAQQLHLQQVTASTLTDTDFYRMLLKRYQDSYFSISKQNQVKTNAMCEIKTVTDAFNVFVARLISQTDPNQIGGFLEELKADGVFEDGKYYSRLKKKIQDVATKANIVVSDELIKELDDEVRNCGAYY